MNNFSLGKDFLDCNTLVSLASKPGPKLVIEEQQNAKILKHRKIVDNILQKNKPVYGINTGFGFLSNIAIAQNQQQELQENLIRSHACGVGEPLTVEQSRALLIIRTHTLAKGLSGVRKDCLNVILNFLENDCIPVIPSKGSVGASGDLAPLAHLALALMAEGKAMHLGKVYASKDIMEQLDIKPFAPKEKEGLSLINGTCLVKKSV